MVEEEQITSKEIIDQKPATRTYVLVGLGILIIIALYVIFQTVSSPTQESQEGTVPLSPEQRAIIEERLKNNTPAPPLSPEQRAIIEARLKTRN